MKKWTVASVVTLLLVGCSNNGLRIKETPEGNQSVASLDEAGSVHVAVLAVTPWEEVKSKLRPNLKISESDLRSQAIPVTFTLLDKYLDILRFQAAIAPSTVKTTETSTSTSGTGKDDVTNLESTTTKAPGEARKTEGAAALAAGSAPAIAASGASIGAINSSLTARAIASFVQDVAALNAEVDGAAKRTGYDPYLMRVQVTVIPRRRHLGYDVYSNLSFFGYDGVFDPKTGEAGDRVATKGTPFVVPLLSSDSVETAQRSQSIEALRDVGVALDLVKGFGAAGLAFNSQKDRQQALAGLDVNSVLTMGRLSDNTLRVRFGAAFDPGGGFAAHPRTNTISVLVFFPKDAKQTRVVSRTSWTHVLDGTVLERSQERYVERLKPIEAQWSHLGLTVERLMTIDEYPLDGNYDRFQSALDWTLAEYCERPKDLANWQRPRNCVEVSGKVTHELNDPLRASEKERTYAYVWSHLLSVLPGSRFSTTLVDLPRLWPECPAGSQLATYAEDDAGISVALRGGKDLANDTLQAAVHWSYLDQSSKVADAPVGRSTPAPAAAASVATGRFASKAAGPHRTKPEGPVLTDYVGATLASDVSVSQDRKSARFAFASDRMKPVAWARASLLAPVAIELAGCRRSSAESPTPGHPALSRVFGSSSQIYYFSAYVQRTAKAGDKEAPKVAMTVGTPEVVLHEKKDAETRVSIDLGNESKARFALTANGVVLKSVLPAANIEARADGSYLVKSSGTVNLTFANLIANRTFDLELRPIDENDKLGSAAVKLSLTARNWKS